MVLVDDIHQINAVCGIVSSGCSCDTYATIWVGYCNHMFGGFDGLLWKLIFSFALFQFLICISKLIWEARNASCGVNWRGERSR